MLSTTNILNPRWVTAAVYRILNSNKLFQNKGVLLFDELDALLGTIKEFTYTTEKQFQPF